MSKLSIDMKNCLGIQSLKHEFDFSSTVSKKRVFAIYASNGTMKTSFAKTFEALAKGENPQEERYGRTASCQALLDNTSIATDEIYVLKSDAPIRNNGDAISNILVNPQYRDRYNELNKDIDQAMDKLITALQKQSKVNKKEIVSFIKKDLAIDSLAECVSYLLSIEANTELASFGYATLFDAKALEVIQSPEFIANAKEFSSRYQELFEPVGSIYRKGIFNPTKANSAFKTLTQKGFFKAKHRVHLHGDAESIDGDELDKKLKEINARIDGDEQLKQIRTKLEKNAQTQALTDLIESLGASEIEFLLDKLKPGNQKQFRTELWVCYAHNCPEAEIYLKTFQDNERDLAEIEEDAAKLAKVWIDIVNLFQNRFIDMPFKPTIANHADAALGKDGAKIVFEFEDGKDKGQCEIDGKQMNTLSNGEHRALNLLYFIFEVEERKRNKRKTLFIIDDIADSFDYKNKQAIILYLRDLCEVDFFYLIILTHNFDFYRSLNNSFVHRQRCLTVSIEKGTLTLAEAHGIKNVFIKMWKERIAEDNSILYATVPFTRNLLEYTKGEADPDYLKLTSLLHWKKDTYSIKVDDYIDIYNRFFGSNHVLSKNKNKPMIDILFQQASQICGQRSIDSLDLTNKIVMSIAIRMKAEQYMIDRIRILKKDNDYWFSGENQFGKLYEELKSLQASPAELSVLDKISITVSSNIHLNSFMYEPILDLSLEYLVRLYNEVSSL